MYPGEIRNTKKWILDYKKRAVVEQTIQFFESAMSCGDPKTRDIKTIKADMLLAGIAQLVTVILADKLNKPDLIRSLRPIIA